MRLTPFWACLIAISAISLVVLSSSCQSEQVMESELSSSEEETLGDAPWELVYIVDGQWATAIEEYNGKLYVAERDYMNHTAHVYETEDGVNFTKMYDTQSDQVFVMGVNELNDTLYIGTLWRLGQGLGGLYYVNQTGFGEFPIDRWWNSSGAAPAVPLSMHMYQGKFFVGGLAWEWIPETGNKMWVKYENPNGTWNWTDMDQARMGVNVEAYSMEEYMGKLYVGTFEPAEVVVYDEVSNTWDDSLSGIVDGAFPGNSGVIELINFSGQLHGLTWAYGNHWIYDGVSWTGGNVSEYGGFGRAIVRDGVMYAGTTPYYEGIKPWTFSNISKFDGVTWSDVQLVKTIVPSYFAKFKGYIYATAGRNVYRLWIGGTPPITQPATNVHARLEGPALEHVRITWDLSVQDVLVSNYSIYYSSNYSKDKTGYKFLDKVLPATDSYLHMNAGVGNASWFSYYIQANGTNSSVVSVGQAGKYNRTFTEGLRLVSVPLQQQDNSLSSVFRTVQYDRIWTYDPTSSDSQWKSAIDEKPWSDLDTFDFQRGYWINLTSNCSLVVAGRIPDVIGFSLKAGWNLVPFSSFGNYSVTMVMMETGATRVKGFRLNDPYHLQSLTGPTKLLTGDSYWIQVPADMDWILN